MLLSLHVSKIFVQEQMSYLRVSRRKKNASANLPTEDENTGNEKGAKGRKDISYMETFSYNLQTLQNVLLCSENTTLVFCKSSLLLLRSYLTLYNFVVAYVTFYLSLIFFSIPFYFCIRTGVANSAIKALKKKTLKY